MNPPFGVCLLRHMLERLSQVLLAERKLANGPDLGVLEGIQISMGPIPRDRSTYWLEGFLDLRVQSTSFQSDNFWGRVGIVRDGRATFRTE